MKVGGWFGRGLTFAYGQRLLQQRQHQRRWFFLHQWRKFDRWQDRVRDNDAYRAERHRIENTFRLSDDMYISPEYVDQGTHLLFCEHIIFMFLQDFLLHKNAENIILLNSKT